MTAKQQFSIRPLVCNDYDQVIEVWAQAGLSHRPLGRDARHHFQHELKQPTAQFLCAEAADGTLVGVVLGTHDGRKGWINRLAVIPEARGQGVAKALAREVERRLHHLGIRIVTCLIEGDNVASKALFAALGYVHHPDVSYYSKRESADW